MPEIATVTGASTRISRVGAATSSSSTPHQRCCWIAPPALVAVVDQMPITAAPRAA